MGMIVIDDFCWGSGYGLVHGRVELRGLGLVYEG